MRWQRYFERWPFDDLHRFHRPAALLSVVVEGGSAERMTAMVDRRVEFLRGGIAEQPALPADMIGGQYSEADLRTLQTLGVLEQVRR